MVSWDFSLHPPVHSININRVASIWPFEYPVLRMVEWELWWVGTQKKEAENHGSFGLHMFGHLAFTHRQHHNCCGSVSFYFRNPSSKSERNPSIVQHLGCLGETCLHDCQWQSWHRYRSTWDVAFIGFTEESCQAYISAFPPTKTKIMAPNKVFSHKTCCFS